MKAQDYEDRCEARIKFASINKWGHLTSDAAEEYDIVFAELPQGWTQAEQTRVTTRSEGSRQAWVFSKGQQQIAAVEHETGVEILLTIGTGLATTAIWEFGKWAWGRWTSARALGKTPSSLVVERIVDRFPDGRERIIQKAEIRGPLDSEEVGKHLADLGGRLFR